MSITNGYLTLAVFKQSQGITTSTDDSWAETAVETASRAVDAYCERRFFKDTTATARTYYAEEYDLCRVDDFHTTTGLEVATDLDDDGTFELTWTSSDYQLEPLNGVIAGVSGWPYTRVRAVEARQFPWCGKRARVQVTAQWGWAAVPKPVEMATQLLAADLFKAKDAPFGIAGIEGDGVVARIRANPQVKALLMPYVKSGGVRVR